MKITTSQYRILLVRLMQSDLLFLVFRQATGSAPKPSLNFLLRRVLAPTNALLTDFGCITQDWNQRQAEAAPPSWMDNHSGRAAKAKPALALANPNPVV